MNEQLIREIVDLSANKQVQQLTSDLEKNNKALQDNIVAAKQLNDILSQSKGYSDYNKNQAASAKQQEQLAKLTASRQLQEEKLAAFRAQEQSKADARAAKEEANLKKIEEANNKAAEAARKRAQIVKESTASDLAASNGTSGMGGNGNPAGSSNPNANAIVAQTGSLKSNTEAVKANTLSKKQLAIIEAQEKENLRQNNLALKAQARELNAAKGSVDQRRAALVRLQKTFDALSEQERSSPFGQRLATVLPQLNDQVLALEKSTGRSQRNVGNYLNKAWGGLKLIANILPGLGIAGLLGFILDPLLNYISTLDLFNKKLSEVAQTRKMLNDVNLQGAQNAQLEVTQLKVLYSTAQNTVLTDEQRYNAAKKLQELYPETFKNYSIEQIQLGKVGEGYRNLANEIIATARARASEAKIAENSSRILSDEQQMVDLQGEREQAVRRQIKAQSEFNKQLAQAKGDARALEGVYANETVSIESSKIAKIDERINGYAKDREILNKRNLALTENIVKQQLKGAQIAEPNKPETVKNVESAARRSAAALIQIQIDANKEAQSYFDEGLNNQQFSLDSRLEQLKNYSDTTIEVIRLEGEKEKAAKKLTQNEILAIDSKTASEQQKVREDAAKKTIEITKQSISRYNSAIAEQNQKDLTNIEKQRDEELSVLTKSYNDGFITLETFNFRKAEIERNYTAQYIGLQIEQTKAFIENAKARGENTEASEAQLASIQLKYSQLRVANGEDENKKRIEQAKERFELEKQIGQELFDLSTTFIKRGSELRLNALQEESDALNEKRAFDIEQINDSILTEEEKADRISIINARADADQQLIDQRVRQEKTRQARADKAAAISQALINGALAMTKVAAQTGVLSFAFSPLIAALTAVQIAAIVAQPIPKYKHGKSASNNYSGPAWVGDGGMSELVIEPNGSMWVTPNKPTLTHVGKDTEVISGPDFKRMLAKPGSDSISNKSSFDVSALIAEQRRTNRDLSKAFKSSKTHTMILTEKGLKAAKKRSDIDNKWHRRNFG